MLKITQNLCVKQTVVAIIENKGKYWVGYNSCDNPQTECPRGDLPKGVGYTMCNTTCKQTNHAEVNACMSAGKSAKGATLYLLGHTYCCDNCKKVMKEHGISNVVIVNNLKGE